MTIVRVPITTKEQMYELLQAGHLGNTIQMFFSLNDWLASNPRPESIWGVRSRSGAADARCRLDVHCKDVEAYCRQYFPNDDVNISEMIDPFAVLRAEVIDTEQGLYVYYVPPGTEVGPGEHPWRDRFKQFGQHAYRTVAYQLLRHYLWPSDFEDLMVLLELYPSHVVEFSACDRAVGLIPHRNTCVWEVRCSTGEYERWVV